LTVQPIEYISDDNTTKSMRVFRENYWIKELRTAYPYGLNERTMDGDATKNIPNIYSTFSRMKPNRIHSHKHSLPFSITDIHRRFNPKHIFHHINKLFWNDKDYLHAINRLLLSFNNKQIKTLLSSDKSHNHMQYLNPQISSIIHDIFNFRLHYQFHNTNKKHTARKTPDILLKIPFHNKAIEHLELERIIHDNNITACIPNDFKTKHPTIIYKYNNPIRNKIYNYKHTIDNINQFDYNAPCTCTASPYCNKDIGHVITGDLSIIQHRTLRKLISYGPTYRTSTPVSYDKITDIIKSALNKCICKWTQREHVDTRILYEWKNKILIKIKNKLHKLSKYTHRHNGITWNDNIRSALSQLHRKYVVVGADKATNNVIIICKKYYLECIKKELNLDTGQNMDDNNVAGNSADDTDNDDNNDDDDNQCKCKYTHNINQNHTYIQSHHTIDCIINRHIQYGKKHDLPINDNMLHLPLFYAIPKMHKVIPKMRYIAASHRCTTKHLSHIITLCLKLITQQHRKLCNQIHKRTGVNRMWIIDNNKDVLHKISYLNNKHTAKDIATYDFSTLYTNIPHTQLKKQMKWVLDKAFYNKTKQNIYVSQSHATWYKRRNTIRIDYTTLLNHIHFLIDNIYIKVGQHIFRQQIGIPMGTDCAPFLANLFLYSLEYNFLEKLTKENIFLARKFTHCYRYIDDLITFNNNGLMTHMKHNIYPTELILNKENKHDTQCTYLDISMNIVHKTIHTDLYDKRNDFNFTINNFPFIHSNIHGKRTHGIIISQLIRFIHVCDTATKFIHHSKKFINTLITHAFNQTLIKQKISVFYDKYHHLIQKCNITKKQLIKQLFP